MTWVQDFAFDYTSAPDTIPANLAALDGLTCVNSGLYYVQGGRLRSNRSVTTNLPRYLAGSDSWARHKVVVVADQPTLGANGGNPTTTVRIFAVDHYLVNGLNLYGGFYGDTNFGPLNSVGHENSSTFIDDASNAISNPSGSFTITLTNDFSDGTTTNLTCVLGANTISLTGMTQQPANGLAGVCIGGDGTTCAEQGIQSITIYHWVPGPSLDIVTGTGFATLSGTTLTVAAPTYTPANNGDTINYAWKYTTLYNGTPATISGHSGSVVAPAVIPDLVWAVPSGQQNEELWIVCEIDDGITTYAAQGYFLTVFAVGDTGVYTPAYVPAPVKPVDATLQALWTPPVSGKTIYAMMGDSIKWQQSTGAIQMQAQCDALFGAGKVLVINGGNPGTLITDWYQDVVVSGPTQSFSQIPGYDTYNNYLGLRQAILDNLHAGDQVIIDIALGTNLPDPIGTYLTDIETLLEQLAVTYADFVEVGRTVPMVLHDLPTFRYNQFQSVQGADYEPFQAHLHYLEGFFSRGHLYPGTRLTRPFFMTNHAIMQSDGIHPDTDEGNDAVERFQLLAVAPVIAAMWAIAGSSIPTGSHPDYVAAYIGETAFHPGDNRPLKWSLTRKDGVTPDAPSSAVITVWQGPDTLVATPTPVNTDPSPPAGSVVLAADWANPGVGTYLVQIAITMPGDEQVVVGQAPVLVS